TQATEPQGLSAPATGTAREYRRGLECLTTWAVRVRAQGRVHSSPAHLPGSTRPALGGSLTRPRYRPSRFSVPLATSQHGREPGGQGCRPGWYGQPRTALTAVRTSPASKDQTALRRGPITTEVKRGGHAQERRRHRD